MMIVVGFALLASAEDPKPTSLTESVEKRLVQLDVAVEGDREAIRALTAKDVALYVGEREIRGLIVDPLCGDLPTPIVSDEQEEASGERRSRARATFVLFFDEPHLTLLGRERSIEVARELIGKLVVGGARASIVSNTKRVETIIPLTDNPMKLLDGLGRLRESLAKTQGYAEGEIARVDDVRRAYETDGAPGCLRRCPPLVARTYAQEEQRIASESTGRLAIAVAGLADVPAPKALVYFGDTLRQAAGRQYFHVIQCVPCNHSMCEPCQDPFHEVANADMIPSAARQFDAVIKEAVSRNVHFFTIQAEGLIAYRPGLDAQRHRYAQDTLVGLAAETGGEAFLGGASTKNIAKRIDALTACRLLLSFPPGELPLDKAMNVTIAVNVPKVKVRSQGRIVVPSAESLLQSRLLAAFVDPAAADNGSLRALLIPRAGDGKSWKASTQLRLRPTGVSDNTAELGASVVRRDKVTDQFALSIATKSGSREMIVEKSLDIPPGEFSIVAVARNAEAGDIASTRLLADWPDPARSAAAIAPIAALQMGTGAISKDGAVRSSGMLARDVDEPLDPGTGVSLASVVCRGAKTKGPVIVERWLENGLPSEFAPVRIETTGEPCLQTLDVVRSDRLQPGTVEYRIVAKVGEQIVAQESRVLTVGTGR